MKTLFKSILFLTLFAIGFNSLQAQTSACQFSTCVPVKAFQNLDLMQIYGAIVRNGPFTGTISVSTVTVANTVTVTGQTGQFLKKGTYSVANSTITYAAGDVIGGDVNIYDLSRAEPLAVELTDISIIDLSGQTPGLMIDFLENPASPQTDGAPLNLSADGSKYLGSILVLSTDWVSNENISRLSLNNIGITLSGLNWRMVISTTENVTYSTANSIKVKLGAKQN